MSIGSISSAAASKDYGNTVAGKTAAPVKLWAFIGVVVLCIMAYSLFQWFTSDHFHPSPVGTDPLPGYLIYVIRGLEVINVIGGALLVWFCIIKPWRQNGELSWDGMLCITAFTLFFQDPIDNYFNFAFSYNAYMINMTSWATYIPGWESPRQENFPEPLLFNGGSYMIFLCGFTLLAGKILMKCRSSWLPNQSILVHLLVVFIAFFIVDLIVESIYCRLEIFGYGGTYHPLTLWPGEYYQFPLYESACVGGTVTALAAFRHFKDDKGLSFAERGLHTLKLSKPAKKAVSLLAVMGFAHVLFFVVFFVPFNWFTLKADSFPEMSSYMLFEVCGEGTPYACPSREVPIPSKTSLAISPDDPRLSPGARKN